MSDWQPIETAPKDRDVLVFAGPTHLGTDGRIIVGYSLSGTRWWSKPGLYSIQRPTHWMPLPAVPEEAS